MNRNKQARIGIDIGRVIVGPVIGGKADTSFIGGSLEKALETLPSPGAIESVTKLVGVFQGGAWLVSKCGPNVQRKTRAWLRHWDFHGKTGLPAENVRFCLERPQKAIHCKQLKLTHFIDDRLDVLEHLRGLVPNLYLFGEQSNPELIPDWVTHVRDWFETVEVVSSSVLKD